MGMSKFFKKIEPALRKRGYGHKSRSGSGGRLYGHGRRSRSGGRSGSGGRRHSGGRSRS